MRGVTRARLAALALLAAPAGCDACGRSSATPPKPAPVEASTPKQPLAERDSYRSLLHWTDARVAVSSTVDNPRDYPEHLVDGKPETAWNGRTGDLAGGWMAFRVPEAARVRQIRVTCGFDKVGKDGVDLFTANHRIAKLRVTRNGAPLVDHDVVLDTSRRAPQTIGVDVAGGDFVLTVVETVPGTKKEWRELVVSELDVVGAPGAALLASPRTPRVRVGSLDARTPEDSAPGGPDASAETLPPGPYPSLDAYCRRWLAAYEPIMQAVRADERFPCEGLRAECTHAPVAGTPHAALVTTSAKVTKTALALETQAGWTTDAIVLDESERCVLGDPGTSRGSIASLTPEDAGAEVVVDQRTYAPMFQRELDDGGWENAFWMAATARRTLYVCRTDGAAPACREARVVARWAGEGEAPDPSEWERRP